MTDYFIKCVAEAPDGSIEQVGYGTRVSNDIAGAKSKAAVIADLEASPPKTVETAFYSEGRGRWVVGDAVHVVDGAYLRTDGNDIRADEIPNLPECSEAILE